MKPIPNFMNVFRSGKKPIRKLPKQFEGQGEKKGFSYYQLQRNNAVFLYEVTNNTTRDKHYEVFYLWWDMDARQEAYPYQEEVLEDLETFTNNAAAIQRWIQLSRYEIGVNYG